MKYRVKINTPNRIFIIKGKPVRTPAEWLINSSELEQLKLKIKLEAVQDYSIEEFKSDVKSKVKTKKEPKPLKKKKTQTKKEIKSKSTLGKFLEE